MIFAEGNSVVLPALPDLIWGTVSFLIIVVAVMVFAWPKFSRVLDERRQKIEEGLLAAQRAQEEAARERAGLQDQQREAQREAEEIRRRAQANADEIIARAQDEAHREAQRINAQAQMQIKADTESAARVLRGDVAAMAATLANRIVGEQVRLDPRVNESVVDTFLDELENASAAGGR